MDQISPTVIDELRAQVTPRPQATRNTTPLTASLPNDMAQQIETLKATLACDRSTVIKLLLRRGLKTFDQPILEDELDASRTARRPNTVRVKLAPAIARAVNRARANSGKTLDDVVNQAIAQAFEVEMEVA